MLAGVTAAAGESLASRTLELVNIESPSRGEGAIVDLVRGLMPSAPAYDHDTVLYYPGRVVLAGHYDTVPAQNNLPGRIEDGWVHGLGAADMKGGVAVAVEVVRDLANEPAASVDVGLILFGREELPPSYNPLPELFDAAPVLQEAELAILLEPTGGAIHAGCVGNVTARIAFHGVS